MRMPAAIQPQLLWKWASLGALLVTIPAFYVELVSRDPPPWAGAVYLLAALVLAGATWARRRHPQHSGRALDLVLIGGLLAAAFAPPSSLSQTALAWRLGVAFLTLLAMVWRLRHWVTRGGAVYIMLVAFGVLLLCGVGYWWLEPNTPTLADGLWLAFTTAATVGYGDVVPSTPASRIFSVFVVLLGFGVLTLATAAIATTWIETEERRIEREILRDLHHRLGALHQDIAALRQEIRDRDKPPSS
jgi:voltage-gated potassium channel